MAMIKTVVVTIVFTIIASQPVFAHHLWIEEVKEGQWAVIRGILPDRIDPYEPECVQAVAAFGADGKPVDIKRKNKKEQVVFQADGDIAMATTYSEWGYRVNTTQGKRLITRSEAEAEGLRVLSAFFSTHYAKSLFDFSEAASRPTGLRFEIVLMENLVKAAPGSEISVQILFDGKPLGGASLYTGEGGEVVADDDGIARIAVPDEKPALLYARHRIDVDGDDTMDYKIFTTFLTYQGQTAKTGQ